MVDVERRWCVENLPLLSHCSHFECAFWVRRSILLDVLLQRVSSCHQKIVALEIRSRLEWYSANATQEGNRDKAAQPHDV